MEFLNENQFRAYPFKKGLSPVILGTTLDNSAILDVKLALKELEEYTATTPTRLSEISLVGSDFILEFVYGSISVEFVVPDSTQPFSTVEVDGSYIVIGNVNNFLVGEVEAGTGLILESRVVP